MSTERKLAPALLWAVIAAISFSSCYYDGGPPYNSYPARPYGGGVTGYSYGGYAGRGYYYDDYYGDYYRRHGKDRVKLTAGHQSDKPNRPTGYHTRGWYKNRGYDLSVYKHKHENSGKTHEGSRYKSSNRSSRSHSHSSSSGSRSHSGDSRSHSSSGRSHSSSSRGSSSSSRGSSSSSSSNSSSGSRSSSSRGRGR